MISPPEEFSDYWELETYFRKFGGAIRHSIRGSQETASVRTIDDERQQVQDFFYETKDNKMVMNKNKFPTVKYRTVLEAPEPVKTVGQPEEVKIEVNATHKETESKHILKIDEELVVEIDKPNPESKPKSGKKSKTN